MKKLLGLLKKVAIGFVVLVVAVAIFGGGESDKSSSGSGKTEPATEAEASSDAEQEAEEVAEEQPEEPAEPEGQEPEEVPVEYQSVSANDLFELLDDNPLNARNTYKDAPVRLTGVLDNVDSAGKYFGLGNGDEWSFKSVHCTILNDETLDRIASASIGDTLTVCGTITDVGEVLGYYLDVDYIE